MADVGMNLAPVLYYGTEFPFLDRMKMQSGWNYYGQPAPVDAHGNPLGFPAGANLISTIIPLDPVSAAPTDVYELTYSGAPAAFQIVGATILSTAPGKVVFQYTSTDTTMASLIIRSMSASDPVHDIHVVRQDEVAAFNKGELFNSEFLDQVSHWQTLRFMDWGATNGTTITSWDQRAHVDDASWAQEGNSASVPIEVMIQLANEAHTDMWYNIPTQADDTYVRNALQMIKDRLAPGLKVHVEYSNEVWNSGFQQSQYAQAMANKLWGVDANHDGAITGSEQVTSGNNVYYGYRSAQIAAIANSVFSGVDDNRLEMVFATQNGNSTLERYLLDGIAKAHVGSISALFDEWSVTSYFGLEFSGGSAADRAKVLGWARSGQAGIDAALQELAHGGAGMDTHYSIDDVAQYLAYEKTVADRYGLDLVGYEGGFHGSALYFGADQQTVMDFFARLMADPGMENVYKYWFDTFENAGGKMLAAFNDVQGPSVRGYFGTLDTLYGPKTERYNALLAEAAPKQDGLPVDYTKILHDLFPNLPVSIPTVPTPTVPSIPLADTVAVHKVTSDFNGDGRSDILWRNDNGQLSNWIAQANGSFVANDANAFTNVATNWHVAGTGDFNGDGRADVLWRSDSGQLSDWLGQANGAMIGNDANAMTGVSTSWHVAATGDFNGDGRSDILWRNDNGQLSDWLGQANGSFTGNDVNALTGVPTNWQVVGTGDFNGDGRSDVLWRSDSGQLSNWLGQANGGLIANDANALSTVPTSWQVADVGDFNGDGRADILWRSASGQLSDWLGQANGGFVTNDVNALSNVPMDWHVVGTGDFNGDGRSDILWRSDSGQLSNWLGQANGGFLANDANAMSSAPTDWHTQAHAFLV